MSVVQRSEAWHRERKFRLTASDFAAAIGLSPYKSRQQLWREKTGRANPFEGNEATAWGELNESNAINAYEIETGHIVRPRGLVVHPAFDWLGASPDGLVAHDGCVECKCPFTGKPHEGIPIHYRPQVVGVVRVTQKAWCDFVSWTPEAHVVSRVSQVAEYWDWMYPRLETFWQYVVDDIEPPRAKKPEFQGSLTIERIK